MKYSRAFHEKHVNNYWIKAPATHGSTDMAQFLYYATEIDKLMRRYLGDGRKKILDHGAGEGSVALNLRNIIDGGGTMFLPLKCLKNIKT